MNREKSGRLTEAVILFLLFGIIGWVYEVGLAAIYGHGFVNRGFLFGPYLPLYGFGALLLIALPGRLMGRTLRIGRVSVTPVIIFILTILLTTAVEYAAGWGLEAVFHQRWWDYSGYAYQLHGRICLSASLRFGIGGMFFLYILTPLFRRGLGRFSPRIRKRAGRIVVLLLILDLAATLIFGALHGFQPILAQPG